MRRPFKASGQRGSILILALWALSFLSVFVFLVAFQVRTKILVLSRLDKTSQLKWLAEAGVRKAKAVFDSNPAIKDAPFVPQQEETWFNNAGQFENIALGNGFFEVSYDTYDNFPKPSSRGYGLTDEARRININKADRFILKRLIFYVITGDDKQADDLAKAILDWREFGQTDIVGFFSDDYYENLEFPYTPKKKPFELLDELLLVKGVTPAVYQKLKGFVTVYGNGVVNINTASRPVLAALGLSLPLVEKILTARQGPDGVAGTADDNIFSLSPGNLTLVLPRAMNITPEELPEIDNLFTHGFIGVSSAFFRIESRGFLVGSEESRTITCVFDGNSGKIIYWREEKRSDQSLEQKSALKGGN
jgi:general secretion pathway protein K